MVASYSVDACGDAYASVDRLFLFKAALITGCWSKTPGGKFGVVEKLGFVALSLAVKWLCISTNAALTTAWSSDSIIGLRGVIVEAVPARQVRPS